MTSWLSFGIALLSIIILLSLLAIEVIRHNHNLRKIPIRISVTGTRGKTSVTRILASILRESGRVVLAKTTGTEARYILPDGTEKEIKRTGPANILEQKKLVRKALQLKADCLVVESMSIHPENHRVETFHLIKPNYTIITNLRPDHLDAAQGKSMDYIYRNDIYPGSTLVIPAEEITNSLRNVVSGRKVKLITLDSSHYPSQNKQVAEIIARKLGVSDQQLADGIIKSKMDLGETRAFEFLVHGRSIIFINAFAANDPLSSSLIIDSLIRDNSWQDYSVYGLLSFRKDRGERSLQWLEYMKKGGIEKFDGLFYSGIHGRAFKRKLKMGDLINHGDPELITEMILKKCSGSCLIFGLGNIGGTGLKLLDFWKNSGNELVLKH